MGLVTLAALCVAGFAILFRLFERYEVPMLPAIAINYAVAFVCGMIVAPPSPATSSGSLLLAAAGLGALFVSIFSVTGLSAQQAGAARTTIAGRMSLVLTISGAVILFDERIDMRTVIGIIIALVGLVLTAAGRAFLQAAQDVLAAAAAARSLAEALAAGRLEHVRVVAPTTTLTDVLAPFLAALDRDDPLITVEEASFGDAVGALSSKADLAILTAPPPRPLASCVVARLPVWAYVSADHPWHGRESVDVAELAEERIITLGPGARPRQLLDGALTEAAIAPRDVLECSDPQVAQALAAAGRGVALVSDDPRFDLRPLFVRSQSDVLELTLHAAWRADHHAASTLEQLTNRLVAFCHERYRYP